MDLASYIDHTLLSTEVTKEQIVNHCTEAIENGFCSVCVQPEWISLAADIVNGTNVKVDAVVGFPLGTETPKEKASQAKEMIFAGADEIDMVADPAAIVEGNKEALVKDLKSVLDICRSVRPAVLLKVIIESASLTDEQIIFACETAQQVGVDFVKTSTGLHAAGGAKAKDVRLMVKSVPGCKIKAAGGIRIAEQAAEMIAAGASRIGTSASIQIIKEYNKAFGGA
jgi:deoxyribose-phosphate aldolase